MSNWRASNGRASSRATAMAAITMAAITMLLLAGCSAESGSNTDTDTTDLTGARTASSEIASATGTHVAIRYPFRAGGNEPGWLLVVTDSLLTLRWDYDDHRADLSSPQIVQAASGSRIIASGGAPPDTMRVEVDLWYARCADDMSGQQFPVTVSVHVNGRVLTGCGGNPVDVLADGTWEVAQLNGKPLVDSSEITMEFNRDGTLIGMAGCNRFTTSFTLSPERMHVTAPATTRMACGDAKDRQEREFLALLADTQQFVLDEQGTLTLNTASGGTAVARRRLAQR